MGFHAVNYSIELLDVSRASKDNMHKCIFIQNDIVN